MLDSVDTMVSVADILAANLTALMEHNQIASDNALAKLAHIDQKTVWRIRHKEQSPTIEKLELLARAFDLHAWQLLIPHMDPKNPPVFVMSDIERNLYKRLNDVAVEFVALQPKSKYEP